MKIYINGTRTDSAGSVTGSYTGMTNTATDVAIGYLPSATTATYANGHIGSVCIYSRELSAEEIATMYHMQGLACRLTDGAVELWPIDGVPGMPILSAKGVRGLYNAVPGGNPVYISMPNRVIIRR
jgi:hypothetical protein